MNEALKIHEDTVANTLSKAPQTLVVLINSKQRVWAVILRGFARLLMLLNHINSMKKTS